MQIVCPQCAASYLVAEAAMGDGRMVRCTNCRHVWLAICHERPTVRRLTAQPAVQGEAAGSGAKEQAAALAGGGGEAAGAASVTASTPSESTEIFADAGDGDVGSGTAAEASSPVPDAGVGSAGDAASGSAAVTIIDAEPGEDNAFVRQRAARRQRAQRGNKRGSNWPTAILTLMVIIAAILAFRTEVVRAMPQTAALFARIGLPVNLRGLEFQQVKVGKEQADGAAVLVVQGEVVNVTRRLLEVPRLRFALRDAEGGEVYHWTALPERRALGPGDAVAFSTRLASPPESGQDIEVRFFSRYDR